MKKIFLVIILMNVKLLNAQTFMGISIDGSQASVKSKLINKGFKLDEFNSNGEYFYKGNLNGDNIIFAVCSTPKSKKVYKFVITFEDVLYTWDDIIYEFEKRNKILINKYGQPFEIIRKYKSPYKEGDGQELSALQSNTLDFFNAWLPYKKYKNLIISLIVLNNKMVQIIYSNAENSLLFEKEQNIIEKETY